MSTNEVPPQSPTSYPAADGHVTTERTRTSHADEGAITLYSWACSCGIKGAAFYASPALSIKRACLHVGSVVGGDAR